MQPATAQPDNPFSAFRELSRPEKWWVIGHLFIAKKTFDISQQSLQTAREVKNSDLLDGDLKGGQADAFKHSYWMARLTQEINPRKARRLGKAHEKGDYLQYKKKLRKGKTTTHDKAATQMDLFNNEIGIDIGMEFRDALPQELKEIIISAIRRGQMRILKKDTSGNFLDENGEIIPEKKYLNKWDNEKVLVPSNETPKK